MKRNSLKIYLLAGLLCLLSIYGIRLFWRGYLTNNYDQTNEQVLGIFDRDHLHTGLPSRPIICYAAVFKSTAVCSSLGNLETALNNQDVFINVETWLKGTDYKNNVLKEVTKGRFDKQIQELGLLVAGSRHQVFIRWNPDMEVPTDVYPWQFKSPEDYINSFHYFSKKIRALAPGAKIIWGPSGYPGDTEYWPGNNSVDYASITLGSPSELSAHFYPQDSSVADMLKHKLHRLRFIDKPILIMSGNAAKTRLKDSSLDAVKADLNQYRSTIYSKNNYVDSAQNKPVRTTLKIGVFDPNKQLINQQSISVEHLFTDWGEVERGDFEKKFLEVINRHHEVIVTMEPWRDTSKIPDNAVLESILKGGYDQPIKKLFSVISATKTTVYLRWMHEMEIPIHRYAWQSQDPVTYINAYRYLMQLGGGPGKNVRKVWGPAGDRGSVDFWPGSDVVDLISIAIYGLPDKNITDPEKQESFSTIFKRKYFRMRFLEKPVFITEFGVKGPEKFQNKWLADAAKTINSNPHIFGICYFNLYDNPKAWGEIKAPDWSITPRSMTTFTHLLNPL